MATSTRRTAVIDLPADMTMRELMALLGDDKLIKWVAK